MYVNLTIIGVLLIMQTNTIVKADPPIPAAVSAVSPYSSLIVSSKAGLFRVEADHADVQSVIKQLFEKGDRQFNLENGLTGIVTLRLTEQPLRVILDEICRQTFIQYHFDATTGIYRFERNQQALRAAIMRLQSLNSLVRQQLGMMGLNINPVSVHSLSELPTASAGNKIPAAGSGLGGGGASPDLEKMSASVGRASKNSGVKSKEPLLSESTADSLALNGTRQIKSSTGSVLTPNSLFGQNSQPRLISPQTPRSALQIIAESRPVSFHIPNGHPLPVAEVLQQIGKQAQVAVMIDPEVPAGLKLRIEGTVSARPLPDLLNILTARARLEWRWDGDHILITPRPDFRLFVGEASKPRIDSSQPAPSRYK